MCVAIILSMLPLISWANIYDEIDKLNVECRAGNEQACANLAEIVKNEAVIGAINDQILLAEIANTDKNLYLRMLAMNKLSDQNIIANIARNDGWEYMRCLAVEKLIDQALLIDIAKNHFDIWVYRGAVDKITDQDLLADVAKNGKNSRGYAVKKLTNQELLADIAKNDIEVHVREAAKKRLEELKKK